MTWQPLEPSSPHNKGKPTKLPDNETQWSNNQYVVNRTVVESTDPDVEPLIHLSIRNVDRGIRHDWRDFQRIKNQLAGPEYEGVEIYPAETRLVDTANQYHIWCVPFQWPIGFNEGRKISVMAQTDRLTPGAVQRDPEKVDLQFGGLSKFKDLQEWLDTDPTLKSRLGEDEN